MTASPTVPATPAMPKTGFGAKLLGVAKNLGKRAAGYAIDQFRANPAVVISGLTRLVNGAAAKLPPKLIGPAQTVIAATSAVAIKSAVVPAAPDPKTSPLQAAAERARKAVAS